MQDRWKVALRGDLFTLSILAWNLLAGDVQVLKEDEAAFLVAQRLNRLDNLYAVRVTADEMLANINLAFSILHNKYSSVEAGGTVIEREVDGSEQIHAPGLSATMDFNVRFGILSIHRGQPTTPSLSELALRAIERNGYLRTAATAFNARPTSFGNLYIAYETVRRGVSSSDNYKDIIALGWASQSELDKFHDTASYYRHGLPRRTMSYPEITLSEATELIRRLLTDWAEQLGADP